MRQTSSCWTVVAVLAIAFSFAIAGTGSAVAQDNGNVEVNVPAVDLHQGTCAEYVLEPEAEITDPEPQSYFEVEDDLNEDLGEDDAALEDDDDALEDDEAFADLNENDIADVEEEGYLTEDLDDDGVLDEGEDLNENDVLDAGIDADGDGTLDEDEILVVPVTEAGAVTPPVVWKGEGDIDQGFEELFEEDQNAILVHQSGIDYETIIACGNLLAVDWEDEDEVVIGLTPVDDSGYYGYAVLERDTGEIPIFGENTTGVTIYLFENLTTQGDERAAEANS